LINKGEFILESELYSEKYYRKYFSKLFPEMTWNEWFMDKSEWILNKLPLLYSIISDNNYNENEQHIEHNHLLINKKLFNDHLKEILDLMNSKIIEEDISVLSMIELNEELNGHNLMVNIIL
jgi:hypothetical protein